MSRHAHWLLAAAIAVGLAVPVAVTGWRWSRPTQPPVADVLPIAERAVASAVIAAGDDAAVAVAGVTRSRACELTRLRRGWRYTWSADLFTDPGREDALIGQIAAGLPDDMNWVREAPPGASAAALVADLGQGVHLAVRQLGEGWLVARAQTGCHPAAELPAAAVPSLRQAELTALLRHLGASPAQFEIRTLPCAGGQIITRVAVSTLTDSSNLAARLAGTLPAGARAFSAGQSNRWAYRSGALSVIVAASDDSKAITVRHTTSC